MVTTANLPPVKEGLRRPDRAGVWSAGELNLAELASQLDIAAEVKASELRSIPDAWAQVQIARQALLAQAQDEVHSAGKAVTREWRALLALFALQPLYRDRYQLQVELFNMPAPPEPDTPVEARHAFGAVLATLLPKPRLHATLTGWGKLGFLFVQAVDQGPMPQRTLVGLLTPDLLVSPTRLTQTAKLEGVPWFSETGPADPTEVEGLNGRDFYVLTQYLQKLSREIKSEVDRAGNPMPASANDPMTLSGLLQAIENFSKACAPRAEVDLATGLRPEQIAALEMPSDLHRALLQSFEIGEIDFKQGPCHLKTRVGSRLNGIVLVDSVVAKARNSEPARTRVWRHHLLSEVLSDPRVLETVRQDAAREGYLVVTADELFAHEFIDLEDGSEIRGHELGGFRSALMPLSPLVLMLMEPSQIREKVRVRGGAGGERQVTLTLAFLDELSVDLSKVYKPGQAGGNASANVVRPSALAVWPDFHYKDWPWNFLRFEHDPSSTDLQTRFGASGAQIGRDLATVADAPQRGSIPSSAQRSAVERARLWARQDACAIEPKIIEGVMTPEVHDQPIQPLQRLRFFNYPDSVAEVQISEERFEALFFARRPGRNAAPRPVGLVLLEESETPKQRDTATFVAIDFGSTNTVSATNALLNDLETGGAGQKVTFASRTQFPMQAADIQRNREARAQGWSQLDFFPLIAEPTPAPTVEYKRKLAGENVPTQTAIAQDVRPLFPDSIFFLTGYPTGRSVERRISENLLGELSQLVFGLKWSDEKTLTRHFLQQFMIMTAAELAARGYPPGAISWLYSYPEAMQHEDVARLKQIYEDLARSLFPSQEPVALRRTRTRNENAKVKEYSEGEAAAAYFLNQNIRDFALILDIGGSTTDAAIWLDRKPIWHGSLRIAGGDLLTHFLVNNKDFLRKLNMPEVTAIVDNMADHKSDLLQPPAARSPDPTLKELTELFFSDERFDSSFRGAYSDEAASGLGAGLRICTLAGIGGVLYYIGKVMRRLIDDRPELEAKLRAPTIAFAGRGALFLKMLGGERPNQSPRLRAMAAMLARGAELDPAAYPADIKFSPEPKLEGVLGMLDDALKKEGAEAPSEDDAEAPSEDDAQARSTKDDSLVTFLPIGEALELGEPAIAPWSSVQDLAGRKRVGSPTLAEFECFLNVLANEAGIDIDLRDDQAGSAKREIVNHVSRRLTEELEKAKGQPRGRMTAKPEYKIEPPFVVALRALLHCLGQEGGERNMLMRVREHR